MQDTYMRNEIIFPFWTTVGNPPHTLNSSLWLTEAQPGQALLGKKSKMGYLAWAVGQNNWVRVRPKLGNLAGLSTLFRHAVCPI